MKADKKCDGSDANTAVRNVAAKLTWWQEAKQYETYVAPSIFFVTTVCDLFVTALGFKLPLIRC